VDGPLANKQSFSRTNLSQNDHTISLTVKDDAGTWSEAATYSLAIHTAPTAQIVKISPSPGYAGDEITFKGTGDDDGSIAVYIWEEKTNGSLANGSTITFTFEYPDTYTIYFTVMDNNGQLSKRETARLEVLPANNTAPTAYIDSITPESPRFGDWVTLKGRGEDPDGTVIRYEWKSSLDDIIGYAATVNLDTLSEGLHTISFRVRDNDDEWSAPATATYEMPGPLIANLAVQPRTGEVGQLFSFIGTDSSGPVYEYFFYFGDGEDSGWIREATTTYSFEQAGVYQVTLMVRDEEGRKSDLRPRTVEVTEPYTGPDNNGGDANGGTTEESPGPGLAAAGLALVVPAYLYRRRGRKGRR